MGVGMSNHPLNSSQFFDMTTKVSIRMRQIKEARTRAINGSLAIYLLETMDISRLKFLRDNWNAMTRKFGKKQEVCLNQDWCSVCSEPAKMRCSICDQDIYCSAGCQSSHWQEHKKFCHYMGIIRTTYMDALFLELLIDVRKDDEEDVAIEFEKRKKAMAELGMKVLKAKVDYAKRMKSINALV
jgi:hypothetical protein